MLEQSLRETIRVQGRRAPLLELHVERLAAGGCDGATLERASATVSRLAARWRDPYGRLTLQVETDGRVHAEISDLPSSIDVAGGPLVALVETDTPQLPPGAAKPADRSFWDAALATAQEAGAHVAVLVDHDGYLIDGSQATLWLVRDGALRTPHSPPALAGVSRALVLADIAPQLGLSAREWALTRDDFDSADEVVLTTAVAGARAVKGRGGHVAELLTAQFDRVFGVGGR